MNFQENIFNYFVYRQCKTCVCFLIKVKQEILYAAQILREGFELQIYIQLNVYFCAIGKFIINMETRDIHFFEYV